MAACLSAALLDRELRTTRFGRAARVVPEVGSTIDLAWQWLSEGAPEGAVVIAARQTRGRGRLGRRWLSPIGGLWMSVIARPRLRATAAGRLGAGMAVAAAEAATEEAGARIGLKWPNDLVIGDRKVGGVLVETRTTDQRIESAVLSLGLNVNVLPDALPAELAEQATSLLQATGREHSLEAIAARALERLECLWPSILSAGTELAERWNRLDQYSGRAVEVRIGDRVLRGRCLGIGLRAELALMVGSRPRRVETGEVRLARGLTP